MSHYRKYDINYLVQESKKDPNVITIEATVVTGFENAAMEECNEKCKPLLICRSQGRIFFNLLVNDFSKVLKLRAVDNLFFINDAPGTFELTNDKEKDLEAIKSLVHKVDWEDTLRSWAKIVNFEGILFPKKNCFKNEHKESINDKHSTEPDQQNIVPSEIHEEREIHDTIANKEAQSQTTNAVLNQLNNSVIRTSERINRISVSSDDTYFSAEEEGKLVTEISEVKIDEGHQLDENIRSNILKFRATCNRVGEHSFSSMEAAACFGGALQDKFDWSVNLSNFDLNVILNINSNNCYVCSAITAKSLHRRNITHFGYTTLRSTLCYNMVRLAEPTKGEIIVDPLCGGGSIPIEGALGFPYTFHVCGDNNDKAMKRTLANVTYINQNEKQLMVDPVQWSARSLPLKDSSVDICVTDLPFGKRSGKKSDNLPLYKDVLKEMGRVSRCGSSRAVLLTHDKKSLTRALSVGNNTYWKQIRTVNVNQGGLFSTVFLLLRTAKPFTP